MNFALRSPDEQDALAAAYGRWLNSLTGPVQILVRAGRADLSAAVAALREAAPGLPHPALEQAALEHAAFLEGLAAERDVLTRQALLIVREPGHGTGRPGGTAAGRALQRAGEAARLLAGAGPPGPGAGRRAGHRPARRLRRPRRAAPAGRADGPARPAGHQRGQARMSPRRTGRAAAPDALAAPDMPGPPSVEVAARHVRTGDDWSATLAVTGYPAEVSAGWLEPLLSYPGRVDVTLHIEPIPVAVAAARLRRQRARLESGRRAGIDRGQLDDPDTEAAADDARDLAYRLARGEGKLFRLGLYLTVHAGSEEELAAEVQAVRALAASPAAGHRPGHLPLAAGLGHDPAGRDRPAAAAPHHGHRRARRVSFPFTSPRPAPRPRRPGRAARRAVRGQHRRAGAGGLGPVGGRQPQLRHPRRLRRGQVLPGQAGDPPVSLYEGTECWVIDPEDEYARLAGAVGGAYIHLGAPGVHLNPFDLPAAGRARADTLTRRALFIHTVIAVLCGGEPSPAERAALDKAIMTAYQQAGITADPRTWARPAPLLPALATALRAAKTPAATALADRLVPFTEGSHSGLFAAPTTTRPDGHLVVFSLRDVPDELRPAATLLALDTTWRAVSDPARRRRRLITVDEAWLLMRDPEGAKFLFRLAKSARKAWAGLAAVTQDAEDVLSTDLGRAVIANSATQILLRQAPQAIGKVAEEFRLSAGERQLLLSARRGEGLLAAGPSSRVSFQAWPRPPSTSCARATPPRSPGCRPASRRRPARPGPARTARPRRTRRTCCHDIRPSHRPARPVAGSARRPGRPVPHQPRRLHRAPGPAAARRPGALRPGRRAAARRRGDRRDRGPGLPAPAAARRVRRGRPAGHRPGPAAGRPGRARRRCGGT